MGDPRAFLATPRAEEVDRAVAERVRDFRELVLVPDESATRTQASRCMDCGIPFCHQGCPVANVIPEWNDHVYRGDWDAAGVALLATNNFPEITGRVCPAPCEASCVLNLEETPVTIKAVERAIADALFASELVPVVAREKSGKRVAVVGSGPAGLAAAQELARRGHDVVVFERDARPGGLLRYGIPDFKLEKTILDRRLDQMRAEGVVFETGVDVGVDPTGTTLLRDFGAILLAVGARKPRDLPIDGRDADGIHFAMDFLSQSNRRVAGEDLAGERPLLAEGRNVVVIGGGDTGSDCVGTSIRQGAASVTQLELMPKPPLVRVPENPWPEWPLVFRTSTSQEEGCERKFAVQSVAFEKDARGRVSGIRTRRVRREGGAFVPEAGSEAVLPSDLVLLAMGFTGPDELPVFAQLAVPRDDRGNVAVRADQSTSVPKVFAAGDGSRGQSLVVWAIADGRRAAVAIDRFLRPSRLDR
ncbi:MAG: glutamate synthase subunit beta [Polyangiaceae bacterium]